MQPDQLRPFLDRFTNGSYTEEEHQAFINWVQTAPIEEVEAIANEYQVVVENLSPAKLPDQALIAGVEAALDKWQPEATQPEESASGTPVIRLWRKVAVAAVVIGLIGLGAWFFMQERSDKNPPVAETKPSDVQPPEITKAMITLADGRTVVLDSIARGMFAVQSGVNVVKNERGEVVYEPSAAQTQGDIATNTLYNPRGSKVVSLTLADGTKVWLNSASSLQYPVAFAGNERKVRITGEAYFEVSKSLTANSAKQTFLVEANGVTTKVLGTHFNVNAYEDEPEIKVTLLEGIVNVFNNRGAVLLRPGQQARSTVNRQPQKSNDIDVDQVMAWKNENFNFGEGTDLQQIMRQVARWYDVDVEYRGTVHEEFGGSVPRQVTAAQLLEKLEMTGKVKFKIEGRKVIVSAP